MKKSLFAILILLGFMFVAAPFSAAPKTVVYFFWGDGCPHCETQKPFLERMEAKYPDLEVKSFETWKNKENAEIFKKMAAAYGIKAQGVPATFIGDFEPIIGYADYMAADIEAKIVACLEDACIDPGVKAGLVEAPALDEPVENQEPNLESIIELEEEAEPVLVVDKNQAIKDETALSVPEEKPIAVEINDKPEDENINQNKSESDVCIHLFYKQNCPQCINSENFAGDLEKKYDVHLAKYNINEEWANDLYDLFKEKYGLTTGAFPIAFIGEKYFIGEKAIQGYLEKEVIYCLNNPCVCPIGNIKGTTPYLPQSEDIMPEEGNKMSLPILGEVDFSSTPLYLTTVMIAFVDGFNPCSLWLIFFLLGMVIYSGSRKKILLVGGTFLLVTGGVYALFMAGLLNIFLYVGYMKWIQIIVALMALIFALVNIKDYFWYKKGLSFTVSDKYKPSIFKRMRDIMKEGKSSLAVVLGTVVLALGVVLVELPCTAGFPVIWTGIIAQNHIAGLNFYLLLALYMLIYLLDEIIVIAAVFFTMKIGRFEEKHGRILKLIGGMIMLALALVMIFRPELMNNISGSLLVFAAAIIASLALLLVHRLILPKMGIKIGTEEDLIKAESSDQPSVKDNNN